jgi:hypothetical protein
LIPAAKLIVLAESKGYGMMMTYHRIFGPAFSVASYGLPGYKLFVS